MMIYVMFHKFANGQGKFFNTDGMSGISGLVPHPGTTWSWFRIELFVSPGAIENLHMMICKQILGIQKQTTNVGVLLEMGRIPLSIWAAKFSVKTGRLSRLGEEN